MLQVPPGEGGGGANLIDIEEGQNKTQVFTSYKEIKQGNYSLRRPPKLIIPQKRQKRHQLAPRFDT